MLRQLRIFFRPKREEHLNRATMQKMGRLFLHGFRIMQRMDTARKHCRRNDQSPQATPPQGGVRAVVENARAKTPLADKHPRKQIRAHVRANRPPRLRGREKEQKMNRHSASRVRNLLCLFIGLVGLISAVVFILK